MLKRTQQAAAPHLLGEDITRGPHLWQRSGTRGSRRQRAGELRCCQFSWKTVQKSTAAAWVMVMIRTAGLVSSFHAVLRQDHQCD